MCRYATGFFGKWHIGSLTSATVPDCQPVKGLLKTCTPGYLKVGDLCCDGRNEQVPVLRPTDVGFDTALATPTVSSTATANCGCVGTVPGAGKGCELGHYKGVLGHFPATQPWLLCEQYLQSTPDGNMVSLQQLTPMDDAAFLVDHFETFAKDAVSKSQPFFAQISFHHNHIPYVAPPEYRALYPGFDENHQDYYGALTALDDQVKRVRQILQTLGVADNTFLALTSDNGPETSSMGAGQSCGTFKNPGDTAGLLGRKRALTEGGIRVAGIVEYPPLVKVARVEQGYFPASTNDFLPTLLDIAGVTANPAFVLDGVSLLPVLAGQTTNRTEPIGWYAAFDWGVFPPEVPSLLQSSTCLNRAVQAPPSLPADFHTPFNQKQLAWTEGPLKLFACSLTPKNAQSWRFALYDVVADPKEAVDLWPQLGATVGDAMFQRFLGWQHSVEQSVAQESHCTLNVAAADSVAVAQM